MHKRVAKMDGWPRFRYTVSMTWTYYLFVALLLGLTSLLSYSTYATARLLKVWRPDHNLLLMPAENLVRLMILIIAVALGYLSRLDPARLGWQAPAPLTQLWVGICVGLALAFVFHYATRLVVRRTGERFYSSTIISAIVPRTVPEFLWILLALIPVVLVEELLFRSLLIGGLSPLAPEFLLVLVFGVVFGLLHSPQGVWGMAGASLGGVVFGLLFLWQHSLWAPVVAHYVANAVQIALVMGAGEL